MNFYKYFGVPKEQRFDYYLQLLVSKKTNFDVDKIEVLYAKKTRIEEYNEFNNFIFTYKKIKYRLLDDDLKKVE